MVEMSNRRFLLVLTILKSVGVDYRGVERVLRVKADSSESRGILVSTNTAVTRTLSNYLYIVLQSTNNGGVCNTPNKICASRTLAQRVHFPLYR